MFDGGSIAVARPANFDHRALADGVSNARKVNFNATGGGRQFPFDRPHKRH